MYRSVINARKVRHKCNEILNLSSIDDNDKYCKSKVLFPGIARSPSKLLYCGFVAGKTQFSHIGKGICL